MTEPLVKICGIKTIQAAECAIINKANLLGVILVPNRARTVDDPTAIQISKLVRSTQKLTSRELLVTLRSLEVADADTYFETAKKLILENGPYLVGVFRNQPLEEVEAKVASLELDFVQLHGSENFSEYIDALDVPVICRYVLDEKTIVDSTQANRHVLSLFDSEAGGEGKLINWADAEKFGTQYGAKFLLAGGLTPENVSEAVKVRGCIGVDVAGGVETAGEKDLQKIEDFIRNAKQ